MKRLVFFYLALAVVVGIGIYCLPPWIQTCLAVGGGVVFVWFVLYINRHSE